MQNSMYYTNSGLTSLPQYQGGGYLDQYGRQRYRFGKFVKKITKPVVKVLDKIIPNEIKPILPYAALMIPGLQGAGGLFANMGITNTLAQKAIISGLTRGLTDDQAEFKDIARASALAIAPDVIQSGLGSLGDYLNPITTQGVKESIEMAKIGSNIMPPVQQTLTQQIGQLATQAANSDILRGLVNPQGLMQTAKAVTAPSVVEYSVNAMEAARKAQEEYQRELQAMGNMAGANKQDQINYIRRAMQSAGFNEDEIASAITRSGFMYGGNVEESGLMNLRMGGMPAEMDLRKGGFVPLGKKERADDVPARLSKNEFVFTAKAVRNAGGGDIRKGAKRMYQIMNQLEARA